MALCRWLAEALPDHDTLPMGAGLGFGQGVGAAWAQKQLEGGRVYVITTAAELVDSLCTDLAGFAVREGLDNLVFIALASNETARQQADELSYTVTLKGFHTATTTLRGLSDSVDSGRRGRPVLLVCHTSEPTLAVVAPNALQPLPLPARVRTPLPIAPECSAASLGAFATGVALGGGFAPISAAPLAIADGLKPALRFAARVGLPTLFVLNEEAHPADALWSLRLVSGLDVWRASTIAQASMILDYATTESGPSVITLPQVGMIGHANEDIDFTTGLVTVTDCADPMLTLLATGSDVSTAVALAADLGVAARILAVPCVERFAQLSNFERRRRVGSGPLIVLEAGVAGPWSAIVGGDALVVTTEKDLVLGRLRDLVRQRFHIDRDQAAPLRQAQWE